MVSRRREGLCREYRRWLAEGGKGCVGIRRWLAEGGKGCLGNIEGG